MTFNFEMFSDEQIFYESSVYCMNYPISYVVNCEITMFVLHVSLEQLFYPIVLC